MGLMDLEVKCAGCGAEFIFTAGEQLFFVARGFANVPKRCKRCRAQRHSLRGGPVRVETRVTCYECGLETCVPFRPRLGKPVLCRECFQLRQSVGSQSLTISPGITQDHVS
jgi:CxxC-x17-CxxC domain-containing protein